MMGLNLYIESIAENRSTRQAQKIIMQQSPINDAAAKSLKSNILNRKEFDLSNSIGLI